MIQPIRVLLVEDNPGDADLTLETLSTSKLRVEIDVVVDGAEALDYLTRRGRHTGAPSPDLIVLDLNLPRVSGIEVLSEVRRHEHLRAIPIVILTSSDSERDIVQSYRIGANCYVTKPLDLSAFQSIVRTIEGFWLTVVKLP
jgi:two-component system, chemotaxis family, response regulator Rcp1